MKILIVLAHPKPDSFNAAVCGALCEGLGEAGHETDVADLYAEGFDPVMRAGELDQLGTGAPRDDIAAYQRRISRAEGLAFIFPIWWFGPPAILKGFVDRVLQEGFAFEFAEGEKIRGRLPQKKALVVNTAGASAALYRLFRFSAPLEKTFDRWTLKTCGIRSVRHLILHDVAHASAAERSAALRKVRRLGSRYF
jgi:NAD(P)H dehydrogenase (quinone)